MQFYFSLRKKIIDFKRLCKKFFKPQFFEYNLIKGI